MTIINILLSVSIWNLLVSILNPNKTNILYCGIVGFSGKGVFDKQKINQLMIWNSFVRGEDATGIYSPKNGLKKDIKKACDFLTSNTIEEDNLLIAHVRAKTVGINIAKNAHPFNEGNVILAHNGTLKNHYQLLRKYNLDYNSYDVDSHIMTAIIDLQSNFKVLTEIEGAAAVLITNKLNPNLLYAYRNSERPLFKGNIDGDIYISSIKESLELIGCLNIKEFKENTVYTIKDGSILSTYKIKNVPYVHNYGTTSNVAKLVTVDRLLGMNLTCSSTAVWVGNLRAALTYNKKYKVIGFSKEGASVQVKDDKDQVISVARHYFDVVNDFFTINDYVKSIYNLKSTNKDDPNTIDKNDNCLVTKEYDNGMVEVLVMKNNVHYDVLRSNLIKLTPAEEMLLTTPTIEEDDQLSFANIFIPTENFYNKSNDNVTDENDIEAEESEDEDNDDWFDLHINEAKLTDDLIKIDELAEIVYNYGCQNLPDDKVLDFKSKFTDLELHLLNCAEYYTNKDNA